MGAIGRTLLVVIMAAQMGYGDTQKQQATESSANSAAVEKSASCALPMWRFVFRNDKQGRDEAGKREHLIQAIRRGSPIRVSWGESGEKDGKPWSCEEFADATFTTVTAGRDVIVQFHRANIQTDYVDATKAKLRQPPLMWNGLMSSDGRFDAYMLEVETNKIYRRLQQRAAMNWYIFGPDPACDDRPVPPIAVKEAIVLDKEAMNRE